MIRTWQVKTGASVSGVGMARIVVSSVAFPSSGMSWHASCHVVDGASESIMTWHASCHVVNGASQSIVGHPLGRSATPVGRTDGP